MILTNTAKVLDKLKDPESILNIPFWLNLVETLIKEIDRKKVYHAKQAVKFQPKGNIGELPTKEESTQFKRYQYNLETANLYYAIEKTLSCLIEGTEELSIWCNQLKHREHLHINKKLSQLVIDYNEAYKEARFWHRNFLDEVKSHQFMTDLSIDLARRLKKASHDSKN